MLGLCGMLGSACSTLELCNVAIGMTSALLECGYKVCESIVGTSNYKYISGRWDWIRNCPV